MLATPTLSNARTTRHQLSSCYVGSTPDNIEGIFDSYKEMAPLKVLFLRSVVLLRVGAAPEEAVFFPVAFLTFPERLIFFFLVFDFLADIFVPILLLSLSEPDLSE